MIANHCHPDGTGAYPSIERIAAQARISERGARYAIETLEKSGELVVKREKGATPNLQWKSRNIYSIPGVVRDGFYRDRLPKPEATGAAGNSKPAAKNGIPSGKASGNELPPNYPKELEERNEQVETAPSASKSSEKSKSEFNYKNFSRRYYKLVGTTPAEKPWDKQAYTELCQEWGEDAVIGKLKDWVDNHGGQRKLKGNQYAHGDFLKEVSVMLEEVPDDREESYAHGVVKEDRWKDLEQKFPRKD